MDFIFSDEQQQLRDSLQKYISKEYGFEARRAIIASKQGFSDKVWAQFADMGILGVAFDEAHGGFGGSSVDTMLVMTEVGRGIVVEPYFSTVVLGGSLIDFAGSEAQKQAILSEVTQGKMLLAAALGEPNSRFELNCVETTARRDGTGFVLNGHKAVVLHGESADKLVVSARTAGGAREAKGISLFLVDRKRPASRCRAIAPSTACAQPRSSLLTSKVGRRRRAGRYRCGAARARARRRFRRVGAVCRSGGRDGSAQCRHLRIPQDAAAVRPRRSAASRRLQHRAVDMMIHNEQSRSLALLASVKVQSEDPDERRRTVSAAKIQIGRSGRAISQEAIQMHGGMGVSNELAAGHYAKRLTMINATLGDVEHHSERFASAA